MTINERIIKIIDIIFDTRLMYADDEVLNLPIDRFKNEGIFADEFSKILEKLTHDGCLESVEDYDICNFDPDYVFLMNYAVVKPNYNKLKKYRNQILKNSTNSKLNNSTIDETTNVKCSYNKESSTGNLNIKGYSPFEFSGRTAQILFYFYETYRLTKKTETSEYKTYNDFNSFLQLTNAAGIANSQNFSQSIREINRIVNSKINIISEIIIKKEKEGKRNLVNKYKWNYKIY